MPPAAMALISEPSMTFQPTEASMAEIASRISTVSQALAFSPPSSVGMAKRKMPSSTSASTVSLGRRRSFCASSPPLEITSFSRAMRSSGVPDSGLAPFPIGAAPRTASVVPSILSLPSMLLARCSLPCLPIAEA